MNPEQNILSTGEPLTPWLAADAVEQPSQNIDPAADHFRDRREKYRVSQDGLERRQFSSNYHKLSPAGAELGKAIDSYKVANRRRYITYDEILAVLETLGYQRPEQGPAKSTILPTVDINLDSRETLTPSAMNGPGFVITDQSR